MTDKFQVMIVDINNTCNIRCIFCINNWNVHRKIVNMDNATFNKALELLPLTGRCFFSCAYEPTMHPKYIELFKQVPKTEAYTFITTNLSRRLSDEEIEELSSLKLNSITISVSSFKPEVYESLHLGAKFDIFINNLERMVTVFKLKPDTPKLRFITIAFKQNLEELVSIAEICNKKYLSTMNQFRTIFLGTPRLKDESWKKKSMVTKEEYESVVKKLKKLPYNILFFDPFYNSDINIPVAGNINNPNRVTNTYFSFRSDGSIVFHESDKTRLPEEFKKDFNINEIDNPYEYFKKGLEKIC